MRTRHYLDEIEINPPNNYKELEIELNYDTDGNQQSVSINDWEFGVMDKSKGNDGALMCKNQLFDQTGVGVVQGKPFKITIDNERGKTYLLFNGYVDLWKAQYANGKVIAPAVESGKIDWLNDYADSFSFEYLYSIGFLKKDMFVPVPYVIVKKQDSFEVVMTLVTIFVITDTLKKQITEIAQLAAGSANPLEMTSIPRLIFQIIYLILLFASLIPLILKLINMLVPPVKYHNVMYVRDLFEIACKYMGLTFKSSILQTAPFNKMVIMPEKYNLTENKGLLAGDFKNNNEKVGYFKGTFGDLIRAMKIMFHGKVVISDNNLYLEPFDFKLGSNGIVVPYSFANKDTFTLNYDDFFATMIVSFLTDLSDRHTIQEYKGTSVQVTQTTKSTVNPQLSLLRNLDEARISFALAKVKKELTNIEEILLKFSEGTQLVLTIIVAGLNLAIIAINILIAIIQKILKALSTIGIKIKLKINPIKKIPTPNLKKLITNRIDILKMESDYVAIAKIFLIDQNTNPLNTKISSNNQAVLNAKYLFDNFHYLKSFVSINGKSPNQYMLRKSDEFPFSFTQFETIRNNNAIFTPDGDEGDARSLRFNPEKQTATCDYRVKKQYISNLKLNVYEPDGQ